MVPSRDDWLKLKDERHAVRRELVAKLEDEGAFDLAERLAKCGQRIRLVCNCCGDLKDTLTRCDLKWCPACQHHLAAQTAERFANICGGGNIQWPLLVTFTAKNFGYREPWPVRETRRAAQTIKTSVSPVRWIRTVAWSERLRRQLWFRSKVKGGVLGFEVTDIGNGFHVHAHALLDCKWLSVTETAPRIGSTRDQVKKKGARACKEVGDQWELCCQRSASVDVRRVWTRENDIRQALVEVVKYSTKGVDLVKSPRPAAPLIRLLDGCRMVTSFGTMFGRPECKRVRGMAMPCEACGKVGTLAPLDVVLGGALDEHGLRSKPRRR